MIDLTINKSDLKPKKRGQWDSVRNRCGCYIFSDGNLIQYVGRSNNLYQRLISHYTRGGICSAFNWDAIHIVFCENHKEVEKYLIEETVPTYNGSLTSNFYYT